MSANGKLGMVLSGGGARGAYQVGVVQYLAEQEITPHMFSGASIGALNGALVASSPDMQAGAVRLERVWRSLSLEQVVKVDYGTVGLALLWAAARTAAPALPGAGLVMDVAERVIALRGDSAYLERIRENPAEQMIREGLLPRRRGGLLDKAPLKEILEAGVGMEALQSGRPLWVSVYPSKGALADTVRSVLGSLWLWDTPDSVFLHVQSLAPEEQMRALLASAAVPLLYDGETVEGDRYSDGGQGGWKRSQGNTPITPLVEAGCTCCIVTHLSDGSLWDRHEFPGTAILEVRPERPIHADGALRSMMQFSPDRIDSWISQGREDAERCIGGVLKALRVVHAGRSARERLLMAVAEMENGGFAEAMKALE